MSKYTADGIVMLINSNLNKDFLETASIALVENAETVEYKSAVVNLKPTLYREAKFLHDSRLLCRVKDTHERTWVAFPVNSSKRVTKLNVEYCSINSDPDFVRITLDSFADALCAHNDDLIKMINEAFISSINFDAFGCCQNYMECSEQNKCVHDDLLYATACMYRKNLENGRNFYKESSNSNEQC